jgi:hypothetical protein
MTVLTKEQADELLSKLPRPNRCDLCNGVGPIGPWTYGPFTVHICVSCATKYRVQRPQERPR